MNAADRQQPAGRVLPLLLDEYLQQFRSFEQSVLTDQDPEDLHSLRVALRRARSLLSLGGAVFPSAQRKELIQQMRDFGSISSQVRDLDVLIGDLPKLLLASRIEVSKLVAGSPAELLQQTLVRQREAAFTELARAIDATAGGEPNNQSAAQYSAMLRNWQLLASVHRLGGEDPGPDAFEPAGNFAQAAIFRQFSKVRSAGCAALKSGESADWHRLRKRAKSLRYALAGFGPLFAQDPKSELVLRLRKLQNVLGLSQDHAVQISLIEQAGLSAGGRTALLAGGISSDLRQLAMQDQDLSSQAWCSFDPKSYKKDLHSALSLKPHPSQEVEGTQS